METQKFSRVDARRSLLSPRFLNTIPQRKFRQFATPPKTISPATLASNSEQHRIPLTMHSERPRRNAAIPQEDAMWRTTVWRTTRMSAFALAVTLLVSGFALARDDDDYYRRGGRDQARQYGYQKGFQDGVSKGRHEGRERDPNDYLTPDWRRATHGYKGWMGPVDWYQRGCQEGYSSGFRSGYQEVAGPRGSYFEGRGRPNNHDWRGGYDDRGGYGGNIAYRVGYEDGSSMAREDIYKRKSYNPNPRGRFGHEDRGYHREYGNKNEYKADYANGYRTGYEAVMGHRY
jgi:hypothetical protein